MAPSVWHGCTCIRNWLRLDRGWIGLDWVGLAWIRLDCAELGWMQGKANYASEGNCVLLAVYWSLLVALAPSMPWRCRRIYTTNTREIHKKYGHDNRADTIIEMLRALMGLVPMTPLRYGLNRLTIRKSFERKRFITRFQGKNKKKEREVDENRRSNE